MYKTSTIRVRELPDVWHDIISADFAAKPIHDFSRAHISNTDENVWKAFQESMRSGFAVEINESIYDHYLECLPPVFQYGNHFGFAEGAENVIHFWRVGKQYFCRQSDVLNPFR